MVGRIAILAMLMVSLLSGCDRDPEAGGQTKETKLTRVVRNDVGELKWMLGASSDTTPAQAAGREIFQASGCVYCHARAASLQTAENQTPRPVVKAGENLVGPGFGPNLSRVGLKYPDDWHRAHFWNPRSTVPTSQMPRFANFFDGPYVPIRIVDDEDGNRTLEKTAATEKLFDFASNEQLLLTPNEDGLVFVRQADKYPVIHTPNEEYTGKTVTLVADTERLDNLIAYLQTLGTDHGEWRALTTARQLEFRVMSYPQSAGLVSHGKEVYAQRCIGCHGKTGNGNGEAATFMAVRPRNFQYATFKFRVTPTGSLPTDGDLMRTLTRGVRGTAMPSFHGILSGRDRVAVIQYVKQKLAVDRFDPEELYAYFAEEDVEAPIYPGEPREPSAQIVAHGARVWKQAKCWECHGDTGEGDGEKAKGLEDDFGYPIPPADLTRGLFKSGPDVEDVYRTITTGLNGTPMPSYADSFTPDERWALAYYVLSLSAFTDPLTGAPLRISAADRTALNDTGELQAVDSDVIYETRTDVCAGRLSAGLPVPRFCEP